MDRLQYKNLPYAVPDENGTVKDAPSTLDGTDKTREPWPRETSKISIPSKQLLQKKSVHFIQVQRNMYRHFAVSWAGERKPKFDSG
ncbi:hypothetical protein DAMNIGENAA_03200 [Desulforhabdus amnigena]|uniref:Uncharacterized protein n=1 Tax=Desulforhabdus amnigena TaxID=40218 RepID=A0A9W6CZ19_9BACT|nr:hypothetical protein DAMNIGENAA_03200 [Desulforhabdus amnigena]